MNAQVTRRGRSWRGRLLAWLDQRLTACARGLGLGALAMVERPVMLLALLAIAVPAYPAVAVVRLLCDFTRRLCGEWCGVEIASPYLSPPGAGSDDLTLPTWQQQRKRVLADPATWRDLIFLIVNPVLGLVVAAGPVVAIVYGIFGMTLPYRSTQLAGVTAHPVPGIALAIAGFCVAPWLLRGYGELAKSLLGPTRRVELAQRVRHLDQTRSDAIDSGAAEIRRIERDLHDGAQARLVAMGMALDAAEQLIETSPDAARTLLAEARDGSVKALAELRDLVRGIHPPVLADRGLADAVRALALDLPLRVHCAIQLPGRPPAPVESAAYFAVSELLANVSRHAEADQAWIDIRYDGDALGGWRGKSGGMAAAARTGTLRITVTDDGRGGADPARGTGLHGIERRLAAFDGVMAVSSPPGGPTSVNMEIPCALSSPKTSSC
jgi:signal transduction histidine kinase